MVEFRDQRNLKSSSSLASPKSDVMGPLRFTGPKPLGSLWSRVLQYMSFGSRLQSQGALVAFCGRMTSVVYGCRELCLHHSWVVETFACTIAGW